MSEEKKLISNTTKSHILQIQKAMRQNKLVIFAGAGVSKSSGVPLWGELISELKKELDIPENETDFLKIPQLYRNLRKDKEYFERIKEILKDGDVQFGDIHKAILGMNPCHIVTTNYDDLFEQAILNCNENYYTVSQDENLPYNRGEKLLIKMHGDFKSGDIVLTENDYFDYSKNYPLIRSYVMSLFASKLVLFIGFSYTDINLKYILRDVRNCLNDKMQPIYMLSSDINNVHQLTYLDSNFIQLVQIDGDNALKILEEQKADFHRCTYENKKSQDLYNQLMLLSKYSEHSNDVLSLFIHYLSDINDQFTYITKYIKYIFPKKYRRQIKLESGTLILPESYKNSLRNYFENYIELKPEYKNLKNDFDRIMRWLYSNGVCEIQDVVSIINYVTNLEEQRSCSITDEFEDVPALQLLYKLEIDKLAECIETLNCQPLKYTKDDLIFPYLLCQLGRYKEAYDCYKSLYTLFIARKKYILAFICKYNMKALYGPVMESLPYLNPTTLDQINEEFSNIDINDFVVGFPLDDPIRTVIKELANNKYLMDRLLVSKFFCQELRKQRDDSYKRCFHFNNNIHNLLFVFDDTINFDNRNFIFNFPYENSKETYLAIAEGILHSILTQSGEFQSSKKECLTNSDIKLFVFLIVPSDLAKLLKRVVSEDKIPCDSFFNKGITKLLDNLTTVIGNNKNLLSLISRKKICEILLNIMHLSIYTKNKLELPNIHKLIAEFWFEGSMRLQGDLIGRFFKTHKLSGSESIIVLQQVIKSNIYFAQELSEAVVFLCNYAANDNIILKELYSIKQLQEVNDLKYIASFCKVASENVKNEIISWLRSKVDSLIQLIDVEIYSGERIITKELFFQLKDIFSNRNDNNLFPEEYACKNLIRFVSNKKYSDIKEVIENAYHTNNCFIFLKDPINYKGSVNEIKGSWLLYVKDQELKELMKKTHIRNIAKKFCDEIPWDTKFKKKIWEML